MSAGGTAQGEPQRLHSETSLVSGCTDQSSPGSPATRKKKSKSKTRSKNRSRDASWDSSASGNSPDEERQERTVSSSRLEEPPVEGRRRSVSPAMGDFIKAHTVQINKHEEKKKGRICQFAHKLVDNNYLANITGIVVMFDAVLTIWDIDARAVKRDSHPLVSVGSELCLVVYTVELCIFFSVKGICVMREMWRDTLFMLDLVVLFCGYVEVLLQWLFGDEFLRVSMLRMLRIARILRLTRILRKSASLKELRRLLTMMATCMKALAWSFLICFGVMSFWAMLIVELIWPIIDQELRGAFEDQDCEFCLRATSSVMDANLLLFKTVIAGDSWGEIAVPVIQAYPATGLIFVFSQLTLVFGVLNLIVAVVVDTFAEARQHDVLNLAEELEQEMASDKKSLQKIFDRIDHDSSGTVSIDELVEGARKDPEFQSRLQVMDIDEVDLQQLFEMIDTEGCGQVKAREFIGPLSRWVRDSKTAPRFVKYNLMRLMAKQDEFIKTVDIRFELLASKIDEMMEFHFERSHSSSTFGSEEVAPRKVSVRGHHGTHSEGLLAQYMALRPKAAQGPDDVEQPPLSRKPTLGLFHGPGPTASSDLKAVGSLRGAVKEIEDELAEAFKKAVEVWKRSLVDSVLAEHKSHVGEGLKDRELRKV